MVSSRMKDVYNTIAGQFAARYGVMPPDLASFGEAFLEVLPESPRIADVGCGAGRDMAWFESKGVQVTGVDLSPGMLAEARQIVRGPLHEMDMLALDLPDGEFDGVWSNASMLHVPKPSVPQVLDQFHRILKPQGILMLGLKQGTAEGWEPGIYANVERFFSYFEFEEIEGLLGDAGFEVVSHDTWDRSETGGPIWLNIIARS